MFMDGISPIYEQMKSNQMQNWLLFIRKLMAKDQ